MLLKKALLSTLAVIFCTFAYHVISSSFIAKAAQYSCPDGVHTTIGDNSVGLQNGQFICPDGSVGTKANDSTNLPGPTKAPGLNAHGTTNAAANEDPSKNKKSCKEWLGDNSAITGLSALCGPGDNSITQLISGVANFLVGIISIVIVIMIITSGIQMAASAGSPDAIKGAKKRLINAIISLALLLSLRAIMAFLGVPIS